MNVGIVGGGAMGRLWAASLASRGHNITVVDTSSRVVDSIVRDGITVEWRNGSSTTARVAATVDVDDIDIQDLVFFFVKTRDTESAAAMVRALSDAETVIVTLQNGWGNADVLAHHYPVQQILVGTTYQGAVITTAGDVSHSHDGETVIGPCREGSPMESAERVAKVLTDAGLVARATVDVIRVLWKKLVFTTAVLPIAALTGLESEGLLDATVFEVVETLVRETVDEANAQGQQLVADEEMARVRAALVAGKKAKASMLQDLEARRITEVDEINGEIARLARKRGAEAPMNEAIAALVHGVELSWAQ